MKSYLSSILKKNKEFKLGQVRVIDKMLQIFHVFMCVKNIQSKSIENNSVEDDVRPASMWP